ncbi:LacI family DNA-binding transcriptional regulator [Dinghuibacter silviterrae]|uniref:LacI family transcriptional regulator n=1 Tax=Dinghuibacter silviterrae TaxID=1539049 RepID=A0A4R8DEZ9_9BACT|nr:LacI family DNA-binding transcriptional regulator [Dinghuibacter silviterrae]TDW95858.1 LacI family transcriptional regulator [Dinghuibacter silviterrae]
MDQKLPTIKEIAKRLNISVSTVSRALHNHPRIGLRTKMQVQKLAEELHYEPNTLAISFKQKKWFTIGVILPELNEQFFSQAISGIEDVATAQNYTVLIGQSHDSMERERMLVEAFRKHRVDGIVLSMAKNTDDYQHLEVLDKYNIPLVYFDRIPKGGQALSVSSNIRSGAEQAVRYLLEKGHKRIALLKGPDSLIASAQRQEGYTSALKQHGLQLDPDLIKEIDLSPEGTRAALTQLLALPQRPTAILCFNDYVCFDAIQAARQAKIRINKDISFVSFANLPICNFLDVPPLASVEQHPYRQGQLAAEMLLDIVEKRKTITDIKPVILDTELRIF